MAAGQRENQESANGPPFCSRRLALVYATVAPMATALPHIQAVHQMMLVKEQPAVQDSPALRAHARLQFALSLEYYFGRERVVVDNLSHYGC